MRVISQVKMPVRDFNALCDLIEKQGAMDNMRSDISIAFAKELFKNVGLLATETLHDPYGDVVIFKMEAIVMKMSSYKNLMEYLSLHLSPESMKELQRNFISEL
jgi:hypothetical protein